MSTTATPRLPIGKPNSPNSPHTTKPSNASPSHFRLPHLLKHATRDASPHSQAMIAAMHALHLSNTVIMTEETTPSSSDPSFMNHIPAVSSRLISRTTPPPPASTSPQSFTLPTDLVTPSTSPPSSLKSALHLPGLPPYNMAVPSHSASPTSPTPNAWAEIASAPATPFVDSRSRRLAQLLNNNTNFPLSTYTSATTVAASTPSYPSLTSPLNQFAMDPWVSIAADPPTSSATKASFAAQGGALLQNQVPYSANWPRVRARTTSATPAQLYESHVNAGLTADLRDDFTIGSAMYLQRTNSATTSSSFVKPSVGFCRSPKTIATAPSSPLIGNSRWMNNEWSTWGDLGLVPEESGILSANGTPYLFNDPKQFIGKNHVRSATTIPSSSTGLAIRSKPADSGPCMLSGLSEDETLELMQLRERFANRNQNEDTKYLPTIMSRNGLSKPTFPPGIPHPGSKKSQQASSTFSYSATPALTVESSASPQCTLSVHTDVVNPAYGSIANEFVPNESALATAADDIAYVPAVQQPNDLHMQMTTDFHTNQNLLHLPAIHGRLESGGPVTLTQTHDPHTITTPTIVVEMNQPPKHIYVSDLPSIVDEVILRKAFRRFGRIDDIRLSKTKMTGNLNGVAYVKFAFADSVIKALASDGDVIVLGKAIKIAPTDPTENPTRKLFFANVWDLTQDDLLPVCKQFGEVTQVDVVADRGMMYVHFKDLADAVQAHHALQGLTINNRYVRVEFGQSAANYESGGHRFHHPNQAQFHNTNPMMGSQSFPMYYHRPQTMNQQPMYPMANSYGLPYPATQPQLRPGSAPNPGSAYVHQGPLQMFKNTPFPCEYPGGAFDPYPHGRRSRGPSFNGGSSTEFNSSSPYDDYAMMEYHQHTTTNEASRFAPSSRPSPRSFAYNIPPSAQAYEHWQRHQQQFQPRMYPPQVSAPIYPPSMRMDHSSLLG